MDGLQFDAMTRSLATATNRRRLFGGLAAGLVGLIGGRGTDAATCRGTGRRCAQDADCCSGSCDEATRTCGCPPGTMECRGTCVSVDGCCIDGAVAAGSVNPTNECEACRPEVSATGWSGRDARTACGTDGCGGTCDGTGTCSVPTPVARLQDCVGRCTTTDYPATVTICGQEVSCPTCSACLPLCDGGGGPIDGPYGVGIYCLFSGGVGSCSTMEDCHSSEGCSLVSNSCEWICY